MRNTIIIILYVITFFSFPFLIYAGDPGGIVYYCPQYQTGKSIIEELKKAKKNKKHSFLKHSNIVPYVEAMQMLFSLDELNPDTNLIVKIPEEEKDIVMLGFGWSPHDKFDFPTAIKKMYNYISNDLDTVSESLKKISLPKEKDIYLYSDRSAFVYTYSSDSDAKDIVEQIVKYYEDNEHDIGYSGTGAFFLYLDDKITTQKFKNCEAWELSISEGKYFGSSIKYFILPEKAEILTDFQGIIYPKRKVKLKNGEFLYLMVMQPKIELRRKIYKELDSILLELGCSLDK